MGRFFLTSTPEDVQRLRLNSFKALESHQDDLNVDSALKEFIFTSKNDTVEEFMSYNEILDHIQSQDDQNQIE